jgi:hypothetical protein
LVLWTGSIGQMRQTASSIVTLALRESFNT